MPNVAIVVIVGVWLGEVIFILGLLEVGVMIRDGVMIIGMGMVRGGYSRGGL